MSKKKMTAFRLDGQTLETIKSIANRYRISQTDVITKAVMLLAQNTKTHVLMAFYDPYNKVFEANDKTIEKDIEKENHERFYGMTIEQIRELAKKGDIEAQKELEELDF